MSLRKKLLRPLCKTAALLSFIGILSVSGFGTSDVLAQAAGTLSAPPAQTFGSWTKICNLPAGTPNVQCEITQSARAKDRPDISFRVSFIKRPAPDTRPLLRVIVPIRVELPLGVGIMVDGNKDLGHMSYRWCRGENCVAEALLEDKELQTFLNGKTATFYVFTTPEDGVGGVIDLDGVKQGYQALP